MEFTAERITSLQPGEIFVFGSNLGGYHGGGAASVAYRKFGARWGCGVGLQGGRMLSRPCTAVLTISSPM